MSHNKNYSSYYRKEETKEHEQKVEEVQTPEVSVEESKEEAPVEEPKVEEPVKEVFKPLKTFAKVIGGKRVNMRYKPTRASQPINIIPCGAKVTVLEEKGEWWKVRYRDYTGYMMSEFLAKE